LDGSVSDGTPLLTPVPARTTIQQFGSSERPVRSAQKNSYGSVEPLNL